VALAALLGTLNSSEATALGFDPKSHVYVPVMTATGNTGPATDTTNNQIEELFNNVIKAGQGIGPLQTVTMQNSGPAYTQTGQAFVDPVFAVWNGGSATPDITDVTLTPTGANATNLNVGAPGVTISTQAPPAATVATLPKIALPWAA